MRFPLPVLPAAALAVASLIGLPGLPIRAAGAHPAAPLPAFVKPLPVPLEALPPPDQASAGSYLLLIDQQEDMESGAEYGHYATRVLSEAGLQEASQISVDRDPAYQTLQFHRITLWRNGAATELLAKLKPTVMRREQEWEWGILDGQVTQLFSLEDVRVGDVIEYAYTLRGANPIFAGAAAGERYLQFAMPVERIGLRLFHAAGRKVTVTSRNLAPGPARRSAEGRIELAWNLERVRPLVDDPETPSWHDPYQCLQWSEYASWAEVVAWALPLYPLDAPMSRDLERVVARLEKLPPRERIRRVLRLVQDDIRYLGLEMGASSHRPGSPSEVYARRYGDCKDKSLLFCALMRRLGVQAVPVLVNSRVRRGVADFRPSPLAFDHVIARIGLEGKRYYFDPTRNQQRGDPLETQDLLYGRGLAIAPGGGGLDTIDPGPTGGGAIRITQAFTLASLDSAADLVIASEYTGGEADKMRSRLADDSREELGRSYLNFYAKYYPRIRPVGFPRIEEDTAANRLVLREAYRVDSLCSRGEKPVCEVYPQDISHWIAEPDRRIRNSPYGLAYPKTVEQEITLALPFTPRAHGGRRHVGTEDFGFTWNKTAAGNKVSLQYSYQAKSDHVPLERFAGYLDAIAEVEDNLETSVQWAAPSHPLAPIPLTPVPPLVFASLVGLIAGLGYARRLRRMHSVEPPMPGGPPPPIRGWLYLLGAIVLLSPLGRAWYLSSWGYLFDPERWARLTTPSSGDYHVLWALFLMASHAAVAALVSCWASVGGAFLRKERAFVDAFVSVSILDIVYSTFEYVGLGLLPDASRDEALKGAETLGLAIGALLSIAMIRIVTRSRRVAETFVAPRVAEGAPAGHREKSAESAG